MKTFRPKIKIELFVEAEDDPNYIGAFLYVDSDKFEDAFRLEHAGDYAEELSRPTIQLFIDEWRSRASKMNIGFEVEPDAQELTEEKDG